MTLIRIHYTRGIDYQPGEVIFREGDAASSMFFVQSAEVDLLVGQQLVETVGVDGFFGEMGMLESAPRSAHCHCAHGMPRGGGQPIDLHAPG